MKEFLILDWTALEGNRRDSWIEWLESRGYRRAFFQESWVRSAEVPMQGELDELKAKAASLGSTGKLYITECSPMSGGYVS